MKTFFNEETIWKFYARSNERIRLLALIRILFILVCIYLIGKFHPLLNTAILFLVLVLTLECIHWFRKEIDKWRHERKKKITSFLS